MKAALLVLAVLVNLPGAEPLPADLGKQARAELAAGHQAEACALYERLASLEPGEPEYRIWIGRLCGWMGDYTAAVSAYDAAFRQLTCWWRLRGSWDWAHGKCDWGTATRRGFQSAA